MTLKDGGIKMSLTQNKGKAVSNDVQNNARLVAFQEKLKKQTQTRLSRNSRLVCGIWGEPKTVKSGLALDFPDKQIYVLDWMMVVNQHGDRTMK